MARRKNKVAGTERVDAIYHDLLSEASRAYRAFKISDGMHPDDAQHLAIHSNQVKAVLLVFARIVDEILKLEVKSTPALPEQGATNG